MTVASLPLLTPQDVMALLQVSRNTVFRLPIPYLKIGNRRRYRAEDVQAYIDAKAAA